ncbi:MAG: imidazolonepropionase [Deltaproteobacteria bacterium]
MQILIRNSRQIVTFAGVAKKKGVRPNKEDLSVIEDGAILIEGEKIVWVGKEKDAPKTFEKEIDAERMVILPGLVDAHTHLVFSGSRHEEFSLRCEGKSYLEIARGGGGIQRTVRSTRSTSFSELLELSKRRLAQANSFGITTLEIKSGYGLSYEDEIKQLEVIEALKKENETRIVPTFLGAHDFPPEFKNKKEAYVSLICDTMIPEISKRKLAEFCDVFIDEGFFSLKQTERILKAAAAAHLKIRIHSDEFKALGGTELAVKLGAHSVDHLMAISKKGISALKKSMTVATLLPGTSFFLGKPYAPARKLIDEGIVVALATDFNPGSSPTQNLPLIATIAATQMKMTVPEILSAMTFNAAKSLGRENQIGSIEIGKEADLAFFDLPSYEYLPYHFGDNFCKKVIFKGQNA